MKGNRQTSCTHRLSGSMTETRTFIWSLVVCSMLFVCTTCAYAQKNTETTARFESISIGYLSHRNIIKHMPQYADAQRSLKELKNQYEAEAKRSEKEFQAKFEEFLQTQKDLPQTILIKRQNELQSMMDANITFRIKVEALLKDAEEDMMADVKSILKDAINSVAAEQGINIVLNTDGEGVSYVTPGMASDITIPVMQKLGIAVQ